MNRRFMFKDKTIGTIIDDGFEKVLVCHRYPNHVYRIKNSFGMAEGALNELSSLGVKEIRFVYHGQTGESVYIASPDFILNYGTPVENKDYEKQLHLNLDKFERVVR